MTRLRTSARRALATGVVALVAATLSACNDEPSAAESTQDSDQVSGQVSGETVDTDAPDGAATTDEPAPESEPTPRWQDESDPGARLHACSVGTWHLDNAAMATEYSTMSRTTGLDNATTEITGLLELTLGSDGQFVLEAHENTIALTGSTPGGDMTMDLEQNGTESGTWSTAGTALSITGTDSSDLGTVVSLTVDGRSMPTDHLPVEGQPWSGTTEATCGDDSLVLTRVEDGVSMDVPFERVR